ncbi:MAG: lycopene cyclase domain-containing protein [Microbacteriaceae bacterium]
MRVIYLLILLTSIGCMMLLDHRYRLFFWKDAIRAALVLTLGVVFFLSWDLLGIGLGIFSRGETPYMVGLLLGPELPVEEPIFLGFLCYLIMVLLAGTDRILARRRRRFR